MAHITEFKIEGLLGRIDPIHEKLDRHINVFFGENGSGKTTLLKILDAALSRDGTAMSLLPVRRAEVYIYSIDHDRIIKHSWERSEKESEQLKLLLKENAFVRPEEEAIFKYVWHSSKNKDDWKLTPSIKDSPKMSHRWAHVFLPTTRLYVDSKVKPISDSQSKIAERVLDQAFAESVNKSWLQFYSRTLTEVRQIQEEGLRTVLAHVLNPETKKSSNSTADPDIIHQRVVKFLSRQSHSNKINLGSLENFSNRYKSDDNLRRIVDNLSNVERKIEDAMILVDQFTTTINSLFSRGKKVALASNELQVLLEDGKSVPLENLSSGEKHLIKIILSTMTAGRNSILIDEPELSMHIDWQRAFVKTLRSMNPECQLLLASHSPEVMADVEDKCIFSI